VEVGFGIPKVGLGWVMDFLAWVGLGSGLLSVGWVGLWVALARAGLGYL
jgi:hypothetical protein